MFLSNRHKRSNFSSALSGCMAIVLLIVYVVGSIEFSSIHNLFHSGHETQIHSAQNEKEACHQEIYHHANNGCQHKTHFVSNDKCPLCHLNIHSDQWIADDTFEQQVVFNQITETHLTDQFLISFENNLQARAPPVL